jgi:putative inorganic carbon (hco3(-)) transporter
MALFVLILYISYFYLQPLEFISASGDYHIGLILLIVMAFACVILLVRNTAIVAQTPQTLLLLAFTGAIAFSRIGNRWFGGAVTAIIDFGPALVVFLAIFLGARSFRRLGAIAGLLVSLTAFLVVLGICAYHFGFMQEKFIYGYADALANEYDPAEALAGIGRRIQALGMLNNPNNLGQAIVMALPLLSLAWKQGRFGRNLFVVILPMALFVYGIYLTGSRGAEVSLVAIALIATRRRFGLSRAVVLCLVFALLLSALKFGGGREISAEESSAQGRIAAWSAGLAMFKSSPIWGVGYNGFNEYNSNNKLTAHNSWVLCFAELGFVGYFVWMALLYATAWQFSRLRGLAAENGSPPQLQAWAGAVSLSFYGFMTHCLFASRTYMMLLYLLIGMCAALVQIARDNGQEMPRLEIVKFVPPVFAAAAGSIGIFYLFVRLNF